MTLNAYTRRTSLNAVLLLAILTGLFFNTAPTLALGNVEGTLPDFAEFSLSVQNKEANVLRGVYVPDILALPIFQQPAGGDAGYVSNNEGEVTQFGMAAQFGNVGLLAHNHLSGRLFSQLAVGQEVRLIYGNGMVEYFTITQILQFQALEPHSQYSSFRELATNKMFTAEQVFRRVYRGKRHVTFQTCIAGSESMSWGRLFVIAVPKPQIGSMDRFDPKVGR